MTWSLFKVSVKFILFHAILCNSEFESIMHSGIFLYSGTTVSVLKYSIDFQSEMQDPLGIEIYKQYYSTALIKTAA